MMHGGAGVVDLMLTGSFLFKPAPTIAEMLDRHQGNTSGFDYLRIILASLVLFFHCFDVVDGKAVSFWLHARPLMVWVVPVFFSLSGFLLAQSLERNHSLRVYALNRGIRIMPALAVEVLLSALLLGPLFTTLPLASYFSDPKFWSYWANIIGWVHFELPGVFENLPWPGIVNRSIWTVPYEMSAYAALGLLVYFGLWRQRWLVILMLAYTAVAATAFMIERWDYYIVRPAPPMQLIVCFMCGALLYQFRAHIRISVPLVGMALIWFLTFLPYYQTAFVWAPAGAYLTVAFGLLNPPRVAPVSWGDYSYGIYLFAYPIQQAVVALWPGVNAWQVFALAMPVCFIYAMFSWHCVEKPLISRRHLIAKRLFGAR